MKKTYIKIGIIILIVAIYTCIGTIWFFTKGIQIHERFDAADINGEVEYARISQGSIFKIKGIEQEFLFYPYTGILNEHTIFEYFAEEGDWIVKPPHADTLKLYKGDKIYLYTFRKMVRNE